MKNVQFKINGLVYSFNWKNENEIEMFINGKLIDTWKDQTVNENEFESYVEMVVKEWKVAAKKIA